MSSAMLRVCPLTLTGKKEMSMNGGRERELI